MILLEVDVSTIPTILRPSHEPENNSSASSEKEELASITKLAKPHTRIAPRSGWQIINIKELAQSWELLWFLTWRDIKVRYKQATLGLAWALLQPLANVAVFVIFFGRMGGLSAGVENYLLFVLCGVLPWMFFGNAIASAGNSILSNERLVTKIYFPRLLVPLSSIGAAGFDFLVGVGLLVAALIWYGQWGGASVALAPLILGVMVLATIGIGSFLSAVIVLQRDVRHILPFLMQVWMFATPAIYLSPESFGPTSSAILPLNPAHGLILNFRAALLGQPLDWYALGVSTAVTLVVLVGGLFVFRRCEKSFADVI